ncbi:MAG: hypothetical protein OXU20_41310 [Myxococcales bacterium]|nr:hypothetical protein [Myxococcales bacterium]MDD9971277.1 hypothetical protein [Myxococcales bacterium]
MNRTPPTGLVYVFTVLTAFLFSPAGTSSQGGSLDSMFERANKAFFQGELERAAAGYDELVAAGVRDADVFYNQGIAHARLGHLGLSILAFERADALRPGDDDVAKALSQARQAIGRRLADKHGEATVRTRPPLRKALVRPFSEVTLTWLLILLNTTTFGALIVRRFTHADTTRVFLGAAAAVTAALTLAAALALAVKTDLGQPGEAALVVAPETRLHEGPDAHAQLRGRVGEGSLARLLEHEGEWSRIRVLGGAEGWVPRHQVATLNPD